MQVLGAARLEDPHRPHHSGQCRGSTQDNDEVEVQGVPIHPLGLDGGRDTIS
jgi:hypothetical protein